MIVCQVYVSCAQNRTELSLRLEIEFSLSVGGGWSDVVCLGQREKAGWKQSKQKQHDG